MVSLSMALGASRAMLSVSRPCVSQNIQRTSSVLCAHRVAAARQQPQQLLRARLRPCAATAMASRRCYSSAGAGAGSSSSSSAASPAGMAPDSFIYGIAASFVAKDHPYDPATHLFHFPLDKPRQKTPMPPRGLALRSPRQRPASGQDAFFVSPVGASGTVALGVADGVGGWMDQGVDPADFSHGLCEYMAAAAEAAEPPPAPSPSPPVSPPVSARTLMQVGYDAVHGDRRIVAGGSTAVVGLLAPDGTCELANLGDSGFMQLRLNAVHAVSAAQTHGFNTPYQLSMVPPSLLARMAAFGGAQLSDQPRDADVTRHSLRHGDVLVLATDGVWDNLFNQQLLHLVSGAMTETGAWRASEHAGVSVAPPAELRRLLYGSGNDAQQKTAATLQSLIATRITGAAKAASVNAKLNGPFAKEVKRYYPRENWTGGKVDDICVVVAVVCQDTAHDANEPPIKSRL